MTSQELANEVEDILSPKCHVCRGGIGDLLPGQDGSPGHDPCIPGLWSVDGMPGRFCAVCFAEAIKSGAWAVGTLARWRNDREQPRSIGSPSRNEAERAHRKACTNTP